MLDLTSTFGLDGLVGHISYILLVVSMMMRRMLLLRIFVTASSLTYLIYSIFFMQDSVVIFWESVLIIVNVAQIAIIYLENRRARFTSEEQALLDAYFSGLPRGRQRALLNFGEWIQLDEGTTCAEEGKPVPALMYIARGEAAASIGGRPVGHCREGSLIGELTVATAAPASATVTLASPALIWSLKANRLRWLLERRPEIGSALEAAFFRAVRDKLVQNNRERGVEDARLMVENALAS